ncbi:MAG TPA: site-2 protease family protein [Candidatus Dormibacteraeota bacterium]|nr:site-2 protease family protein [Candidatus Dormibacteraeota bacterium]
MSSFTSEVTQKCPRCAREILAGALECPQCRTLVHGDQVEQLAAHARSLEAHGDLAAARERWLACLPLLPPQSQQAEWIRNHVRELDSGASPQSGHAASGSTPLWAKRLGPLGPILLALLKFKSLFSFVAFFGFYWTIWGPKFGIGFAVLILIHEMGHFIDIKRRGLPADMPMFLPGLGAYVKWNALGVSLETRSAISLAGPCAGALAAGLCTLLWFQTGYGLWAALARTGAWFNALNLIPLWIFDGNSAANALSKMERAVVLLVSAALGYALGEWVFGLVAAGMAIRLFTRDAPDEQSNPTAAYFVAVLTGLALVLWLVPGQGNGLR